MKIRFFIIIFFSFLNCTVETFDNWPENNKIFSGELIWIKNFGGSNEDVAHSIIETSDGGIAILGNTMSIDGMISDKILPERDFWFLKLNSDGEILVNKTFGGSGDDRGQSLLEMSDGGFLLIGYSKSSDGDGSKNEGQHDNCIIRINNKGDLLWEKSIGFSGHDHAYSIIKTLDGGFFMSGFLDVTASNGEGNIGKGLNTRHGVGEFWGHKLDSQGQIMWSRFFGGTNNDRSYDVVETKNGDFILVGSTESNDVDISKNYGSYDYWVIKIDRKGELIWEKTFGGSGIDVANSIERLPNNNFLILGYSFSSDFQRIESIGESDFWLLEIDGAGNLIKDLSFGGNLYDSGQDICKGPSGSYFLTGYSQSNNGDVYSNSGSNDVVVFHISPIGIIFKSIILGGSKSDLGYSSVFSSSGNLYVVGTSESNDGDFSKPYGGKDFFVAKYN